MNLGQGGQAVKDDRNEASQKRDLNKSDWMPTAAILPLRDKKIPSRL